MTVYWRVNCLPIKPAHRCQNFIGMVWVFHLNTNHWGRDGRGVLHGWLRLRVWWEFWQVCTIKSTELSLAISELTASQKQLLVKRRSLINDHMWTVTGDELRNVNRSSPNRLQRNRTDRGSPNKHTRPAVWLSSMAAFLKMHQSCRDIWLRLMDFKIAQWGDHLECADSTSVLSFLELVWIVPFRDPLIKGFGQTQKKESALL